MQKELAQNPGCPHMCAYKLVTVEFKWMGLQNKMESYIQKVQNGFGLLEKIQFLMSKTLPSAFLCVFLRCELTWRFSLTHCVQVEKRLFTHFHRQLFCSIDKWVGLTMEDIRRMEDETQKELDEVSAVSRSDAIDFVLQPSDCNITKAL